MHSVSDLAGWYQAIGVDIALESEPVDRFAESEAAARKLEPAPPPRQVPVAASSKPRDFSEPAVKPMPSPAVAVDTTLPDAAAVQSARELAAAAETVDALRAAVEGFEGCNLKRTAKNTVFSDGNPEAGIMLVGEAPGQEEDRQGLPFVGRSGQLLDRMLAAIGLDREQAYITNIIPWRPPGNRTPSPPETEICRPFIERHIELVRPKVLVMLGGSSAKTLLSTQDGIMRLRGKWREISVNSATVRAMPTLHPAYLLRQPAHKRLAWQDFLAIKNALDG